MPTPGDTHHSARGERRPVDGVHDAADTAELLGTVYALLGLSILIALLGIANTLVLSILERTREVGLLRAVGMTRAQLRATVRWEAVGIALQGTLLGLVIGMFFGWAWSRRCAMRASTSSQSPTAPSRSWSSSRGPAGLVATVLPARGAANLDILQAIAAD